MDKSIISLFLSLLITMAISAQEITGPALLQKAIAYHDPDNQWPSFQNKLMVTMTTPDGAERISTIELNRPKQYFDLTYGKDGNTIKQTLEKDNCTVLLNGSEDVSAEEISSYGLTCERAMVMKNYYTYLYGLPMKLKDPGTRIDTMVKKKLFKGKEYWVLKATYDEEVGNDVWYFYFDTDTYAMKAYQFFHEESKNDGEYILLTGEETISGIKMPKTRAWFYNTDGKYLGTDVLNK